MIESRPKVSEVMGETYVQDRLRQMAYEQHQVALDAERARIARINAEADRRRRRDNAVCAVLTIAILALFAYGFWLAFGGNRG